MNKTFDFDVDIDMANRDDFLSKVDHVPACIVKDDSRTKHNTGVYFQNIPNWPLDGFAAIDHKDAQQQGWFKVDFLNNSIYKDVCDLRTLDRLVETEPNWELLKHREIVEVLVHIGNHYELVAKYKPESVEQLAMILALIRPAKRHLVGKTWDEIREDIWEKPTDGSYHFKKSHAHAYALSIVVQMNLLMEQS